MVNIAKILMQIGSYIALPDYDVCKCHAGKCDTALINFFCVCKKTGAIRYDKSFWVNLCASVFLRKPSDGDNTAETLYKTRRYFLRNTFYHFGPGLLAEEQQCLAVIAEILIGKLFSLNSHSFFTR